MCLPMSSRIIPSRLTAGPPSGYTVDLALVKKLRSDRKAVAEAELGTQSRAQWYKAYKETPGYPDVY